VGFQPSGADRLDEGLMIQLVLVGVALGEVGDRPVELVAAARYLAMATGSPDRAWARARVQPQMSALKLRLTGAIDPTSTEPFMSRSWRQ
jgi:hypothetical protein